MANDMKVFHDGVEIEYRESDNQWFFELRGRERKADSLKAAKEAIDKPEPKPKKKFEPIAGWKTKGYMRDGWDSVTVTSIADNPSYRTPEVWITDKEGKRSKVESKGVYAATEANDAIRADIDSQKAAIKSLEKKVETLFGKLKPVDLSGFKE